jgi:hypothetical protein
MPIRQLDHDLGFAMCVNMAEDFQGLVVQGVVRDCDADALYVSVIQYLILLGAVANATNAAH